jgi:alkaline phosphatase
MEAGTPQSRAHALLSRRRMLGLSAGAGGAALLPGVSRSWAQPAPPSAEGTRRKKARNVIFMVADGMSIGTLTIADLISHIRTKSGTNWVRLWNDEQTHRATAFTYAANSLVTDSAAGGSAWGIGQRVNNSVVNITPQGATPTPILVHAKQQGKATGLVTTTTVTHATPASFIANVPDRKLEPQIAIQMMERGFDVILGGGRAAFPEKTLALRQDYSLVTTADELTAAKPGGSLLGLFTKSHMSFELDRPSTEPSLEAMTRAAITRLAAQPNGFVLQVEGGRVDHGAHANDAAGAAFDLLAFDRAIAAVMEFARGRDDTLVIITTDHANGNPGLTVYDDKKFRGIELLAASSKSFDWVEQEALRLGLSKKISDGYEHGRDIADAGSIDALAAVVTQATGATLTPTQLQTLARSFAGQPMNPFDPQCMKSSVLGSVLANHTGVAFMSPNHTADIVEVTAWGPGSGQVRGHINNFDLHDVMVTALDLAPAKAV